MDDKISVQPLPYKTRQRTFGLLFFVFLVSLPFLYLYATGYRFDFKKPTNLVSTGGMYVSVDLSQADIYIDGELVRETRTFRKAFYAQRLDVGTHRVHVQKDGYHTWVKELPVSKHLVTEALAFNMPLAPQVRVIAKWNTATGSAVVSTPLTHASATNPVYATSTKVTRPSAFFFENEEYRSLLAFFGTTTSTSTVKETTVTQIKDLLTTATTSETVEATTTVQVGGVKLSERADGEVAATWVGPFEEMPYYYCAPEFPRYTGVASTTTEDGDILPEGPAEEEVEEDDEITMHPVQTLSQSDACEPVITIDKKGQTVHDFTFYPGSTDLVIMVLEDGVYVVEVDNRAWQNAQPLFMGTNLRFHIENGNMYVYDGSLIYQILIPTE